MLRILVIDDEENIRSIIKDHLIKTNYEVIEAKDGGEAIRKIFEESHPLRIDAVVCDIRMSKIYGMDAISYFQTKYSSLPLIVMAGREDVQLAINLLKRGVRDYLVKPIRKDSLLAAIKNVALERHQS